MVQYTNRNRDDGFSGHYRKVSACKSPDGRLGEYLARRVDLRVLRDTTWWAGRFPACLLVGSTATCAHGLDRQRNDRLHCAYFEICERCFNE